MDPSSKVNIYSYQEPNISFPYPFSNNVQSERASHNDAAHTNATNHKRKITHEDRQMYFVHAPRSY